MIIHDVAEYATWHINPPEFYVNELLIKQGTMMIYGAPGVRKSWLAEHLAFCLATGDSWLGFQTLQARVLIVNFEISEVSYHWRIRDMSQNFGLEENQLFVASPGIQYLEHERTLGRFLNSIRDIEPEVIVMDCVSGFFGGDENSSEAMSNLIRNLTAIKDQNQSAMVIIHHANKNIFTTSAMDKSRGHTKLTGWVDTILYMVKQPNSTQVQFGKTRHSRRELHSIQVVFEDYNWRLR